MPSPRPSGSVRKRGSSGRWSWPPVPNASRTSGARMPRPVQIGGLPIVTLQGGLEPGKPGFTEATVLPGRGMMLLQAKLRLPSGEIVDALSAPDPSEAARKLDGGPEDFAGNQ